MKQGFGLPVFPGVAIGPAVVYRKAQRVLPVSCGDPAVEQAKFDAALETARQFAGTQIYSRDFEEFFRQVNPDERDFMFLDPPYDTEFSDYEGEAFTKLDQARLAVALSKTKAKFLLIIKNTPFIEALYSQGFYVRRLDKQYT